MRAFARVLTAMAICGCLSPAALAASGDVAVPILAYHRFGSVASDAMTVRTSTFRWQLEYLKEHGRRVVPLRDVVAWTTGKGPAPPPGSVVITVDDGHASVYSELLPIVREYGIPVTLFVYPSAISRASYALTWAQLSVLRGTGLFDIESHTFWHPNFKVEKRRLQPEAYDAFVRMQMDRPRAVLREHLGVDATLLSWPFGLYDDALMAAARHAGYTGAVTIDRRSATARDRPLAIPRWLVTDADRGRRFAAIVGEGSDPEVTARVVDSVRHTAIAGATVAVGATVVRADHNGAFRVSGLDTDVVSVKAPGYRVARVPLTRLAVPHAEVALAPFTPRALYLTVYGIGSTALRTGALNLLGRGGLNALVIDVKGDRGIVPFRSTSALAAQIGAQKVITIPDLPGLVDGLHRRGVYAIARIVVFKDTLLAAGRPELAVRRRDGAIFRDREQLAWTNPASHAVWDYNIGIAVEAARAGFDEIQFDYTRFPDSTAIAPPVKWTETEREAAIEGFLAAAHRALSPFGVFVAADVFGYVCWNLNDTRIGQQIEHLVRTVDYVCPMLYPSSFQFGLPGYRNPVQHPYEVVRLSLERARQRTGAPAVSFRPWLQAFRDYAFGRAFSMEDVRAQIRAANDFGSCGWMLWNPRNRYELP